MQNGKFPEVKTGAPGCITMKAGAGNFSYTLVCAALLTRGFEKRRGGGLMGVFGGDFGLHTGDFGLKIGNIGV